MARTEEKSLSTFRTWPQSRHFSLGLPSHFYFTLSRLQTGSRAKARPFTQKGKDTYHGGEQAAILYMLEGNGTKERSKEEEKGEEGDVWHCVTAGASRVASLPDALGWRQEGSIDQAWVLSRGVVRYGTMGNRGLGPLSWAHLKGRGTHRDIRDSAWAIG